MAVPYELWTEDPEAAMEAVLFGSPNWEDEGVVEVKDGCEVEPDGTCPHGFESPMLKLGWI